MKIVTGVDWSDEAFAAVKQIGLFYRPDEVVLVHGVDLGMFHYPIVAEAASIQGYDEFRHALLEAGRQAVEHCCTLLSTDIPSVKTRVDVQPPASFILDTAASAKADLVAVGTHDHNRITEVFAGSISHHVLLHATLPTVIVKGSARPISRILMAVEGREDAIRLQQWLTAHPFKNPVAVTVFSVVPSLHVVEPHMLIGLAGWSEQQKQQAEQVVKDTALALTSAHFIVTSEVRLGDPVTTVCEAGVAYDLIVIGSHGRKGFNRFLMGSVSHGIVHRASCSVLVVR